MSIQINQFSNFDQLIIDSAKDHESLVANLLSIRKNQEYGWSNSLVIESKSQHFIHIALAHLSDCYRNIAYVYNSGFYLVKGESFLAKNQES